MIPKDAAELLFQVISECYEPLAFSLFGTIICLASDKWRTTMKKTVLILIIIAALVLSLAACKSSSAAQPEENAGTDAPLVTGAPQQSLETDAEQPAAEAIETAQAAKVVADKGGLDAEIEAGGRNLSGGQRQRLTIARALVKKPDILILDDSASALDFATDAALRRALREDTGDATVFIVSQRTSSLLFADKIIVLDDGEAVAIGSHEALLQNCSLYREIYETQFQKGGESA